MTEQAPTTEVRIAGAPVRAEAMVGPAIVLPLNESPDRRWREAFGSRMEPARYLSKLRFEDDRLVLFPGARTSRAELPQALDEVESAIHEANMRRQAEVAEERSQQEQARESSLAEQQEVDETLEEWSRRRVTS